MSKSLRLIFASSLLILAIIACNAPASQNNTQPDFVATITAQAALLQSGAGTQSTATSVPGPASTAAPSAPTASVTQTTNCRTGPSASYDIVTTLNVGQSAVIVGKDTADNYWIVNNPNENGTCWLWGQDATVTGNTDGLPQMSPPAVPTAKPTKTPKPTSTASVSLPAGPNAPTASMGCTKTKGALGLYNVSVTFDMGWRDNATNESGYHIYKDGSLIATLPANATLYRDDFSLTGESITGQISATYGIEAFNSAGKSGLLDIPFTIAVSSCQ